MATFKDLEDSLKKFMIDEQTDAHNVRNMNVTKYNNVRIWIDMVRYQQPHFIVRISISEAVFSLTDCTKLNGGLGYEERLVIKWHGRMGVKDKLREIWNNSARNEDDEVN